MEETNGLNNDPKHSFLIVESGSLSVFAKNVRELMNEGYYMQHYQVKFVESGFECGKGWDGMPIVENVFRSAVMVLKED